MVDRINAMDIIDSRKGPRSPVDASTCFKCFRRFRIIRITHYYCYYYYIEKHTSAHISENSHNVFMYKVQLRFNVRYIIILYIVMWYNIIDIFINSTDRAVRSEFIHYILIYTGWMTGICIKTNRHNSGYFI